MNRITDRPSATARQRIAAGLTALTLAFSLSACDLARDIRAADQPAAPPTAAARAPAQSGASAQPGTITSTQATTTSQAVATQAAPQPAAQASPQAVPAQQGPAGGQNPPNGSFDLSVAIARVADNAKPAVAYIEAQMGRPGGIRQQVPQEGVGSGFIVDQNGHIVTNNHVVANASQLTVVLPDGRRFDARVIGTDPETDLAVIKIDGQNLPVLPMGNSEELRVGEWVVAIGNALGLPGGPTVTVGVVGALDRSLPDPRSELTELIQTDAAINPGNSGGPLINLRGQVVGINTLVLGSPLGGQAAGLGFAISINSAKPIIQQLIQTGDVVRPAIGVSIVPVSPAIAARFGLAVEQGLLVAEVVPNSGAANAGIRQGDVIVQVDGQQIRDVDDLRRVMDRHQPGDTVPITVNRGGQEQRVQVTLGRR